MRLYILNLIAFSFFHRTRAQLSSCGISGKPSGLIVNGTESQRGAWPWIVTIYSKTEDILLCGGSLIGENMVVTVS